MPKHVMTDLETWGLPPTPGLRSIAGVVFDPTSQFTGEHFYCNVDRDSCENMGLDFDVATIEWWARQSREARDALDRDPVEVRAALGQFADWFEAIGATHIWSNGANFDEPILTNLMKRFRIPVPWKYWSARDTRTIWDAGNVDPRRVTRDGTAHNALADARHQAHCVQLAYHSLGLAKGFGEATVLPLTPKPAPRRDTVAFTDDLPPAA